LVNDTRNGAEIEGAQIPSRLCNLPPFHSVAHEILALSQQTEVDLRRITTAFERDPAFAAEALFLANSALFGLPARVHSVRHALTVLGLDRIQTLALTVGMRALVGGGGPLIRSCWQHTAACAVLCERLAPGFYLQEDRAYTAGLMHDVGRLGLLKSYPEEMAALMKHGYDSASQALEAERGLLRIDHGTAGSWLAKTWAFPASLSEICSAHHEPTNATDSPLLKVVKVACQAASALGYAGAHYRKTASCREIFDQAREETDRARIESEEALKREVASRLKAFGA
jgi:HD-like signal output (HDOD) protein